MVAVLVVLLPLLLVPLMMMPMRMRMLLLMLLLLMMVVAIGQMGANARKQQQLLQPASNHKQNYTKSHR